MHNAVIITAKGGNTLADKHLVPVLGQPLVTYPMRAATHAHKADLVYVCTEDAKISHLARENGIPVLPRPAEMSTATSPHKDVIKHAVQVTNAVNYVILLGNTVSVTSQLIDQAFEILESGRADSCLSVWRAQDDHPFRALTPDKEGRASSFLSIDAGSNRQGYPPVYFFDNGIWAFKRECALKQEGPLPWVWLGKAPLMIEREWVTGRDVHGEVDVSASAWWLSSTLPMKPGTIL